MSQELVHSVVEILDSAHHQQHQLSELLASLAELKQQVRNSAEQSRNRLKTHFENLRIVVNDAIDARLLALTQEVDRVEESAVTPLAQCEDMVQQGLNNATNVTQEGQMLLQTDPDNNIESIVKFKDNPHTKALSSVPEIPSRSAVPNITVEFGPPIGSKLAELVEREGIVSARAPVQITDIVERPGGLIVHWSEVDDDIEVTEFWLQFASGNIKSDDDTRVIWHTCYTGHECSSVVRHLNTNKTYSFRVCGRHDPKGAWSPWSLPTPAVTKIPHFQWNSEDPAYSTSNEQKTATRVSDSLGSVLYSSAPTMSSGEQINFRVLDAGEKSFEDGLGLSWSADDTDSLIRPGAVCVDTDGKVYVDGQAMKTRLSPLIRGSAVLFKTEPLPNGKVRVTVEANEKEMAFDWKMETAGGMAAISPTALTTMPLSRQFSAHHFYFAIRFTHEEWKIAVE